MEQSLSGKRIGRYQLIGQHGSGAMADVYKAFDSEINRAVAIKVLKKDNCVDQDYYQRFVKEARAAGVLSHPNIVTIHDVGDYEGMPYIVMELVEGESLRQKLEQSEQFSLKRVFEIMIQLAEALEYAHLKGIVHRDVKPDNILFMEDGETVKLADFGIARQEDNIDSEKTQAGTLMGTPRYMSPEQALGREVDGRADFFSLGTILYELLTGEKAFKSASIGTLIGEITLSKPEQLDQLPADIPRGLQNLLQRMLEKQPAGRPKDGELAEAFRWEYKRLQEESERPQHRYLPVHVKWTLIMAACVTLVLALSITVVLQIQTQVLKDQALDAGASLANFIAADSAVAILGEDWISLESMIKDASERKSFEYLQILDHEGVVRGATDAALVGSALPAAQGTEMLLTEEGLAVSATTLADGRRLFNFETRVLFNNTEVGRIHLGLAQDRLRQVTETTTWLMVAIGVVSLLMTVVALLLFGRMIAAQLKILRLAMTDVTDGHLDRRISRQRKDDIGEIFELFNRLADDVQERASTSEDNRNRADHPNRTKEEASVAHWKSSTSVSASGADPNDETRMTLGGAHNEKREDIG